MNKNKYDEIMSTQDPVAKSTRRIVAVANTVFTIVLIVLYFIYLIGSLTLKKLDLGEFSAFFQMYNTVSVFLSLFAIATIKEIILMFIELKCKSLDNTYRTSLLAKEIVLSLADDNTQKIDSLQNCSSSNSPTLFNANSVPPVNPTVSTQPTENVQPRENVQPIENIQPIENVKTTENVQSHNNSSIPNMFKPIPVENDPYFIICPQCGRKQFSDKAICNNCGCVFYVTSAPPTATDQSVENIQDNTKDAPIVKNLKPLPVEDKPDLIICPQCGRKQFSDKTICNNCGCIFEK